MPRLKERRFSNWNTDYIPHNSRHLPGGWCSANVPVIDDDDDDQSDPCSCFDAHARVAQSCETTLNQRDKSIQTNIYWSKTSWITTT